MTYPMHYSLQCTRASMGIHSKCNCTEQLGAHTCMRGMRVRVCVCVCGGVHASQHVHKSTAVALHQTSTHVPAGRLACMCMRVLRCTGVSQGCTHQQSKRVTVNGLLVNQSVVIGS